MISPSLVLPPISFGTWQLDDAAARRCVAAAIVDGYRAVDTAQRYHNEFGVGAGIKDSGVDRETIVVSSKLRGGDQGRVQSRRAFFASLRNLQVDYLDIYFIHWPLPRLNQYLESYESLMELRDEGHISHLGVCNFNIGQLESIWSRFGEWPAVNQFELHPGFPQNDLVSFCQARGIHVQGWGVIGRGMGLLGHPTVVEIAVEVEATPAQVCIAWALARNSSAIAKSKTAGRWLDNLNATEIVLSVKQLRALDELNCPRLGKDPERDEEY